MKNKAPKFERTRRICGYLVPSLSKWNKGKKAELQDRVAHGFVSSDKAMTEGLHDAYEKIAQEKE